MDFFNNLGSWLSATKTYGKGRHLFQFEKLVAWALFGDWDDGHNFSALSVFDGERDLLSDMTRGAVLCRGTVHNLVRLGRKNLRF